MSSDSKAEDKRIYLPDGFELTLTEKNIDGGSSNKHKITIKRKISNGGSCLVYRGYQNKSIGFKSATCDVIVKEFYPRKLEEQITRTPKLYRIRFANEETKNEYEQKLFFFCEGQAKHIVFASNNSEHALPPPLCSGFSDETGAFYSVSLVASGKVLSELDLKEYSITDALELSSSISEAIGKVHKGVGTREEDGKNIYPFSSGLYLDLKPENVFVLNNRAYLFDFDTVQPRGGIWLSSYSEGWSAPEQELVSGKGYKDVSKIGYHTDIFSIGAVLFKLLTGKNPYEVGLDTIKAGFDWKNNIVLKDTTKALEDDEFIDELNRLMTAMLEKEANERRKSFACSDELMSNGIWPVDLLIKDLNKLWHKAEETTFKKEVVKVREEVSQSRAEIRNGFNRLETLQSSQKIATRKVATNRFMYNSETVAFCGREDELRYLRSMCLDSNEPLCWIGIYGPGGLGKTRLVYEFCKEMEKRSWRVYYPSRASSTISQIKNELSYAKGNVLVCFDDASSDENSIYEFYHYCESISGHKIRIIVTDRSFKGSKFEYLPGAYDTDIKPDFIDENGFLQLSDDSNEMLNRIMNSFAENVYQKTLSKDDISVLNGVLDQDKENKRVLFALFFVDALCNGCDVRKWDRIDALEMLKRREMERFCLFAENSYQSKLECADALEGLECLIALSYFNEVTLNDVDECIKKLHRVDVKSRSFCWMLDQFNIQTNSFLMMPYPDLLLEYICLKYINRMSRTDAIFFVDIILNSDYKVMDKFASIHNDYMDLTMIPSNYSLLECLGYYFEEEKRKYTQRHFLSEEDRKMIDDPQKRSEIKELRYIRKESRVFRLFVNRENIDEELLDYENDKSNRKSLYLQRLGVLVVFLNNELESLLASACYKSTLKFWEDNKSEAFAHKSIGCVFHGLETQYTGDMVLGSFRCGKGTMEASDGNLVFDGTWMPGAYYGSPFAFFAGEYYEGRGYCQWFTNGIFSLKSVRYEGEWKNGKPNGNGVMTYPDGKKYDGSFDRGEFNGHGIMYYPDGSIKYDGNWVEGIMTGSGKIIYEFYDGGVYEGDYVNGKMTGNGKYSWPDGTVYEGDFVDGEMTGKGKCSWPDGTIYEGDYYNGIRTGKGKYCWPDGGVYEGDFKDGKRTGEGKYRCPNGDVYEGRWNNGVPNGQGILYNPGGAIVYEGEWKDGKKLNS